MTWFSNLKIGNKLMLAFTLVACIAAIVGWVGFSAVTTASARANSMYNDQLLPIRELGDAYSSFLTVRIEIRSMMAVKDRARRQPFVQTIEAAAAETNRHIETYSKLGLSADEKTALQQLRTILDRYDQARK